MMLDELDRRVARTLPGSFAKDFYPRAMRRLAEYGLFRGSTTVQTKHGFSMKVDRLDAVKWYIHYFGEFEPVITQAWKNLLRPSSVVMDIGANVGYHTLLASVACGPQGRVYSFEPSTRIFSQLNENVSLNGFTNIKSFRVAVSDRSGEVNLSYGGDNLQGNSSIVRGVGSGETVPSVSVADFSSRVALSDVDLIKIDVEGAESLVISGMMPVIDKLKSECAIFLEIGPEHDAEILLAPLLNAGFHLRYIDNQYNTAFYRNPPAVRLTRDARAAGELCDAVLCRDTRVFERMEGGTLSTRSQAGFT